MVYGHNNNNLAPCYGCKDRTVNEHGNCHSSCEKYLLWVKELRDHKTGTKKQINPYSCRYFKTKTSQSAKNSKQRYR